MQEEKNFELLKDALEDVAFADALGDASTESAFTELLAGKGIELSSEETAAYFDAVRKGVAGEELDEESLDDVSGGCAGLALAVGVAAATYYLYKWYKAKRSYGGGGGHRF